MKFLWPKHEEYKSHEFPWGTKACTCCGGPLGGGAGMSRSGEKPKIGRYRVLCDCEWPSQIAEDYGAPQCRLHRVGLFDGKTVDEHRTIEQEKHARIDRYNDESRLKRLRKEVAILEKELGLLHDEKIRHKPR